jgi:hypothetical protein
MTAPIRFASGMVMAYRPSRRNDTTSETTTPTVKATVSGTRSHSA